MNYPICANNTQFVFNKHDDIDEQAARLTGYDQRYQQLSSGHFKGSFLTCELDDDLGLYFESTNQVLYQSGVVPEGYYAVGLLLKSNTPLIFNSESFPAGSAFLESPGSQFEGTTTKGMNICVIHISIELLNKFCEERSLQTLKTGKELLPYKIVRDARHTSSIFALVNDFLHGAEDGSLRLEIDNQRMTLKNALATAIEWVFIGKQQSEDAEHPEFSTSKRRKLFHQACELINTRLEDDLHIQGICNELEVSRRTLEYSFNENLEMGPGKYIKLIRLNNIRRALVTPENRSTSIGDLAARWGIWHLGRFSQEYRN